MSQRMPRKLHEAGVRRRWDAAARDAVTLHHQGMWADLKAAWGLHANEPVEWVPGFVDSLSRLVDQGYSLTDIAVMFGVTKEAVRLWCQKHDIDHPGGSRPRLWSWEEGRFVAVTPAEYIEHAREQYLQAKRAEHAERCAGVILAVRALAASLGRPPLLREVSDHLDVTVGGLAKWFGYDQKNGGKSYTEAWDALYDEAGVDRPLRTWAVEDGRWWTS